MPQDRRTQPHLFLGSTGHVEPFTARQGGGGNNPPVPEQDRQVHGQKLLADLTGIAHQNSEIKQSLEQAELAGPIGIQIEFEGVPGVELAFESLANERSRDGSKNIEILNVVKRGSVTQATVFVPEGKLEIFESKISNYLQEKTDKDGKPLDNKALINAIADIRLATLEALWTDDPDVFPTSNDELVWWEAWLPVRGNRQAIIQDFKHQCDVAGITVPDSVIEFPERTVLLAYGSRAQLSSSVALLNCIAELRLAKETAEFFDALGVEEQYEWVEELLARTEFEDVSAVRVCILDTGVNSAHPLLSALYGDQEEDKYTVDADWGLADDDGHGTEMAGITGWGDLTDLFASSESPVIQYGLESVKLLRFDGDNGGRHLGDITAQGMTLPEIQYPERRRVYSMALSAKDTRDRGRPSAWSSTLDSLAVDYINQSQNPRLIVVCAGNVGNDLRAMKDYPNYNLVEDIHDPAQAWNALTAGSFTQKTTIPPEDISNYVTLAPQGGLSPFSSTAVTWDKYAPIKPELVLEGGNAAADDISAAHMPSLSLLTTNHEFTNRLLTTTRATSSSTALLAKMAAELLVEYPSIWPETVRALLVHSADWTEALKNQFAHGTTERKKVARLLRCCGYGVPSLERAKNSANNSLTMVIEDQLQPYQKVKGKSTKTKDMHMHELPWPKGTLADLGDVPVEMTVTLSYFIEPNPSARGVKGRYSYQSHGLRFDVKRSLESEAQFRARINEEVRRSEEGSIVQGGDPNWLIGLDNRHRGSIHKDVWKGSAAELAERGIIAVYPAPGWWRTRQKLERYDSAARYAFVISIEAPETDVDIYSDVKSQIEISKEITV